MRGDSATLAPAPLYTVKELRNRLGLSQRELAALAGIDASTVCHIETDSRMMATNNETAVLLAGALGVEVYEIRWPHGLTNNGGQPGIPHDSHQSRPTPATCPKCTFEISLSGDCGC